ncbi:MAG: histidinol-phosphate transaminase [Spirochaetales bacterium]|nr:histidinol-phosphate transaminase [Spirochaetales bacterium]
MNIKELANPGALKVTPYVPGRSVAEVQQEYGLSEVIKLASNESALGVPKEAVEALKQAAERLSIYPDPVSTRLRTRLGELHGCDSACVTVSNGADGVIYELAMAVIREGDECVYPKTTFPIYENVVKIMRGVPVITPMDGHRIDLAALLKAVTKKTKLLFLTNPNNPTGHIFKAEEIRTFLKEVPSEVLVVLDEAYIDFAPPGADPKAVELLTGGMDNLMILRTFSKIYGLAGIRVGYGLAHKDLVHLIHSIKPPFAVSEAAESMALAALDNKDFPRRVVEDVAASRDYFYRMLDQRGIDYVPSATNFILLDVKRDAKAFTEGLLRRGVIVRSAVGYGLPTCIRVTFGTREENETFFHALDEVMEETAAGVGRS